MESPTKAKNVQDYLGAGYKVVACAGHVRDLPKSTLGVDIENRFAPHYINLRGKSEIIKELRKLAGGAREVYLATDPDREGEAISWHLAAVLGIPVEKAQRVTSGEITRTAIRKAITSPRPIDMDLVDAQQTRRILDRIVGYQLSPYLWKTVAPHLSAGRVQSVATRIIVEREREIAAFIPREYWTIDALLRKTGDPTSPTFRAKFVGRVGESDPQDLPDEAAASAVLADISADGAPFVVSSVKRSQKTRNPAPPFTTSTLQQEASRRLGLSSKATMRIAQTLYEGVTLPENLGGSTGLITYMRTDSQRISSEAQAAAKAFILERYGKAYVPARPRVYKAKAGAQDAHEAIRPANVALSPEAVRPYLTPEQNKLYKLIFDRFLASQMASAVLDTVSVETTHAGYLFRSSGSAVRFPGFLAVWGDLKEPGEEEGGLLPPLSEGDLCDALETTPKQHFTEPPPRYNDGSLVKFLEERGIGRPSTFATIIGTIIDRGYVEREGRALKPTPLGETTTDLMLENFRDIMDYDFTAHMEERLDDIERGEADMVQVLDEFYKGFSKDLDAAMASAPERKKPEPEMTDVICDKCGAPMVIKRSRYGPFLGCSNYPTCKNTKSLSKDGKTVVERDPPVPVPGMICPNCGKGVVLRTGRFGKFYACEDYPTCKYKKNLDEKIGVSCPKCGRDLVKKRGKKRGVIFYACEGYPDCDFSSFDLPTTEKCPSCGGMLYRKKGGDVFLCKTPGCTYKQEDEAKE